MTSHTSQLEVIEEGKHGPEGPGEPDDMQATWQSDVSQEPVESNGSDETELHPVQPVKTAAVCKFADHFTGHPPTVIPTRTRKG